jgi:hypothetical protein
MSKRPTPNIIDSGPDQAAAASKLQQDGGASSNHSTRASYPN